MAEEPSLSYYLPIAGGRIIRFIPFPRVLVLCEKQSFSSRIWIRVTMSISYDDNHYTTDTLNSCTMISEPRTLSTKPQTLLIQREEYELTKVGIYLLIFNQVC